MCKCTPNLRTPFCGKPGCQWPGEALRWFNGHIEALEKVGFVFGGYAWERIEEIRAVLKRDA